MALFVLAFAIALAGLARGGGRARAVRVARAGPDRRGERVHLQRSGARLVRPIAVPIWLALEALAGRSEGRLGRAAARRSGAPARVGDRGRGRDRARVIAIGPATAFVEKIDDVSGLGRPAQLAGLPRRGARDLARGRLPDRPRRGRRRACARDRRARAAYGVWVLARRRLAAAGDADRRGDRLRRRPAVRRDPRRGEGARRDRPAGPADRSAGAPRRTARTASGRPRRPLRIGVAVLAAATSRPCSPSARPRSASTIAPPGSSSSPSGSRASRSPSSASTASPATACAAPWCAARPATCRRRSVAGPRSAGSRATRRLRQPRLRQARQVPLRDHDRRRLRLDPARTWRRCSTEDYVLWERRGETPRNRVLERGRGTGRGSTASSWADREALASVFGARAGAGRLMARPGAGRDRRRRPGGRLPRPATATATLDLPRPGATSSRSSTTRRRRCAGRRRGARSPSCRLAGRDVPRRRRARRLLARRGGRVGDAGPVEVDRPRRGRAASRRRSGSSAGSGSATSPPRSADRPVSRTAERCGAYVDHFRLVRRGGR